MDEFHNAFKCGEVVLVFTREAVLMPEILHELNVRVEVLKDLLFFNLEEGIDARREKHVGSIRLPILTRFLQHYAYYAAKVYQHRQFCLGSFVLIKLQQLLNGVLNAHRVYSCLFSRGKVKVLWLKESLMQLRLLDILLIEFYF